MGFFTPDTTFYSDYTDKGKYLLTWRLSVLFIAVFSILAATFVFIDVVAFTFYTLVFFISLIGFIYLCRTKQYLPIFWAYAVTATILVFASLHITVQIIHYAEFLWVISIVLFSFIGLERKVGLLFLGLNSASIASHMIFALNRNIALQRELSSVEIAAILLEMLFALFTIGYLLNQYLLFQSYAERRLKVANNELAEQNQVIVKKNEENNMLAKEIHHRVKNNLQIVISLLRMHSEEVRSEETKHHFAEATNRIMAMSLIHQKLYQEKELSNIDFESYLQDLAQEILSSSGKEHRHVICCIDCGVKKVGLKTIVPLGLLLNELLTNSLKHAFSEERIGAIAITITETQQGRIDVQYSDNGQWRATTKTESGFGLELIELLTNQLEGNVHREESRYSFELNNLDH